LKRLVLFSTVAFLIVAGFMPVLVMLIKSITVDNHINFIHYQSLLSSTRQWVLLKQSLTLAALTTLVATAVGMPAGILLGKSDLPFRRLFTFLFTIPLLLPPYITAVSWHDLAGREGLLKSFFGLNAQAASLWLFGLPGCVIVLSTTFMPIVMLLTITYIKTLNPHLEEAAKLVTPWSVVLRKITVPMILPGIFLASLLVFILTLGEFSVPMFFRYDVFAVESFSQFSAFYNYSAGTASAIPLALITLVFLVVEKIFFDKKIYQLRPSPGHSLTIGLGYYRWPFFALISLLWLLTIGLPVVALVFKSASLSSCWQAITVSFDSLIRSVLYAALGSSILVILGYFTGYLIHTKALSIWQTVDSVTIFLLVLPGTVIGIGLAGMWNRPETNFIYTSAAIIILGYVAQYTALTSRITVATLMQIPPSMEEAAQAAGAKWLKRQTAIIAPLARRGLITGWLTGYIFCLKDTGITMMVYPPGHDTLPVRTLTLMANGPAEITAALCVIMIFATLIPFSALGYMLKK